MTGWPLGSFQLRTSLTTTVLLLRGRGNQFLWDPSRSVPFRNTWISVTTILAVKLNWIIYLHLIIIKFLSQTTLLIPLQPPLRPGCCCSSHVQLFATPQTAAHQASLSFAVSRSLLKSMSIESVMLFNHLILLPPFPPGLDISQSFPISQLFASGGQSIGASASVLPMNIQGWFPLGLTSLISLQPKGLRPGIISNTSDSRQRGLGPWKLFASYFLPGDLYGRP